MQTRCRCVDFALLLSKTPPNIGRQSGCARPLDVCGGLLRTVLLTIPFLKGLRMVFAAARCSGRIRPWLPRPFLLADRSGLACSATKLFPARAQRPSPVPPGPRGADLEGSRPFLVSHALWIPSGK